MPQVSESMYRVDCTWSDVPHLSEQTKKELLAGYPPHMRDARSKGIPTLGAGAIYPVEWDSLLCEPMQIPPWWPRGYGLDVGWNCTAAIWGAYDRDNDILYWTSEHYLGESVPAIHAAAIKARGAWMIGSIDPAARGRSATDGEALIAMYRELGLNLVEADNRVEAGIYEVWERMETGRLKIFPSLRRTRDEHMRYHRDEKGKIVKEHDHAMDAGRYLTMGFRQTFRTKPEPFKTRVGVGGGADRLAGY